MATIEKRVTDLEYIIGHLPEDLDVRFAGVNATLEQRIDALDSRLVGLEEKLGTIEGLIRELIQKSS